MQSAVIDINSPTKMQTNENGDLFDILFNSSCPVPNPEDIPQTKMKWVDIQNNLLNRVSNFLTTILNHATNRKSTWLRLGGQGGVISVLRAVVFARRLGTGEYCPGSVQTVDALIQDVERILAQEVWRRWALKSFIQSRHKSASDLIVIWQILMEVECRASCSASRVRAAFGSYSGKNLTVWIILFLFGIHWRFHNTVVWSQMAWWYTPGHYRPHC